MNILENLHPKFKLEIGSEYATKEGDLEIQNHLQSLKSQKIIHME